MPTRGHKLLLDVRKWALADRSLSGIGKRVGPHTLRHCFATHLLEDGIEVRIIQALLGHAKLETTAFYTKVATRTLRNVTSPFDRLGVTAMEGRSSSG